MPATAIELTPIFKMGSIELPFTDPTMKPDDALKLHATNYPELAFAALGTPVSKGDKLEYPIIKAPAKTKG